MAQMDNNETERKGRERDWAIKAIRAQNIFTHIYVDNLNNKRRDNHAPWPTHWQ